MLILARLYLCSALCIITNKTAYILNYSVTLLPLNLRRIYSFTFQGQFAIWIKHKCTQERHPMMFSRKLASKHLLTNIFSWQINGKLKMYSAVSLKKLNWEIICTTASVTAVPCYVTLISHHFTFLIRTFKSFIMRGLTRSSLVIFILKTILKK